MKVSLLVKELEDNLRGVLNGGGQPLDTEITGIYYRSDRVKPGGLFVAVEGVKSDGHDFVGDAVSRGACAVVAQKPLDIGVPVVEVADSRYALARLASAFWGHPSRRMKLIGVTGTNGKTTTAFLLDHILQTAGFNTGVIGTVNYHYAGKTSRSGLTTPEAPDLQKILSEMAEAGVTHVILEVSSHGISLERIAGCRFAAGIFTNLSQDHLDFHGDMESYWAAKRRFFTDYIADFGKFAVINIDDKKGRELYSVLTGLRKISVGLNDAASVRASQLRFDQGGTSGRLYLEQGSFPFHSALAGRFNLENLMCASAAAC
ncbi:MAG: Mur ligase family protein, partial [Desulfosalsimonas sp.]